MSTIKVSSMTNHVVFVIDASGDHKQRFIGMSLRQAHDHVTAVLEAINSAQGYGDAMDGKVKTPTDCRKCGARTITPRHVCKKVKG